MADYAIGIDIGGTNTKFGVVDRNGHILEQDRTLTNAHESVQEYIEDLYEKIRPMIDKSSGYSIQTQTSYTKSASQIATRL